MRFTGILQRCSAYLAWWPSVTTNAIRHGPARRQDHLAPPGHSRPADFLPRSAGPVRRVWGPPRRHAAPLYPQFSLSAPLDIAAKTQHTRPKKPRRAQLFLNSSQPPHTLGNKQPKPKFGATPTPSSKADPKKSAAPASLHYRFAIFQRHLCNGLACGAVAVLPLGEG